MDPGRLQRMVEIEEAARSLSASYAGGDSAPAPAPEQRARMVQHLEEDLSRRFPGESPDLLRKVAESQVWGRRRRRRPHDHPPTAQGDDRGLLLFGAVAAVALLALGVFLLLGC